MTMDQEKPGYKEMRRGKAQTICTHTPVPRSVRDLEGIIAKEKDSDVDGRDNWMEGWRVVQRVDSQVGSQVGSLGLGTLPGGNG